MNVPPLPPARLARDALDVRPEVAEQIRARAHRELAAARDRTRLQRLELVWTAQVEPMLAAAGALAIVLWSVSAVVG